MYEYKCKLIRVVDGDTVDVDIDLGFGVWLKKERVRIMGIDTPESRTSNKVEKLFGKAASKRLKEILTGKPILKTFAARDGEDMKGKFGRILGDFIVDDKFVTSYLIDEGHAVEYHGGAKADVDAAHLKNRKRILKEGLVDQKAYDKALGVQNET